MSYQSLARKYRPQRFQDMVGQDAVTTALANAIRLHRAPQGVVFSGVRGVGKTTAARLYAKALNCELSSTSADPCNQCDSCLAVNQGIHEDVLEIDGASNTGVEDIRALQETLEYVPQRSPYKVYIIDEVHMLSQSAFNALLKTLEEPPEHVIFVFATTELGKVPETVLSRCQVFHLKHLTAAITANRIKEILDAESISYDEHALITIAKEGKGSMRDALTFLDQVIALGDGEVQAEIVNNLINAASSQTFVEFLQGCVQRDQSSLLGTIEAWDKKGISFASAIEDVAKLSRHAFVLKELGRNAIDMALLGLAPSEQEQLEILVQEAKPLDLNRIFRVLVRCRKDLDGSELDRFIVENNVLEWCLDPGLPDVEELKRFFSGNSMTEQGGSKPQKEASAPAIRTERSSSGAKLTDLWKANIKEHSGSKVANAAPQQQDTRPDIQPSCDSQQQDARPDIQPSRVSQQQDVRPPDIQSSVAKPEKAQESAKELQKKPFAPTVPKDNLEEDKPQQDQPAAHSQIQSVRTSGNVPAVAPASDHASRPQVLPASWREVVETWKQVKPLQGRMLEETIPLSFNAKLIRVAVDPKSMGGGKLLHVDNKKKVCDGLAEMFGFKGQLVVEATDASSDLDDDVTVQESLLDTRKKEEEEQRKKQRLELEHHPITVEALHVFDGTIESVEL